MSELDFLELYTIHGTPITLDDVIMGRVSKKFVFNEGLENKIAQKLLEKEQPEIRLSGVVNQTMAEYVEKSLTFLMAEKGSPSLNVYITSHGGSTIAGMGIYALFSEYAGGAYGYVPSYAYSAAAQCILMGCLVRSAHKYSRLLCHFSHMGMYVGEHEITSYGKMTHSRKILKDCNDQAVDLLARRSGQTEQEIRKFLCKGHLETAQEYKNRGLIDATYFTEVKKTIDKKNGKALFRSHTVMEE